MASDGGGKVKQKRNQTPSKPYERQSTLLGKLKDSVKDLLIPSWLSGTPGKQKKADDQASSSHSYEEVNPVGSTAQGLAGWNHGNAFQPENRTAPSSHMGGPTYVIPASGNLPSSNIPGFGFPPNGDLRSDQSTSLPVSKPPLNFNLGSQTQHIIAPNVTAGGMSFPKHAESSLGSDSVNIDQRYSGSAASQPQDFDVTSIRPIMVSTGMKSSSKQDAKRQRLWSPEPLRQGKPLVPPPRGKPTFNSLLFGTPSKGDTSVANSFGNSSFYVGKTCYGGASSATRKTSMNTSLPYQSSLPLRKQVKATKLNSSLNATTSATAQRILDTLERMSTPLEDAKKIPQGDSGNDSVLSFTPSTYRRQTSRCSVTPITRPLQLPNRGPPKGQLQSTPQIEIARNRDTSRPVKRDHDQTLSITQEVIATEDRAKSITSQLTTSSSCKMKTKKFSQHISGQQEEEVMDVPNLRTDFTLPLSTMPPISLSVGCDKPTTNQSSNSSVSTKHFSSASLRKFTFATPIEEKNHLSGHQIGHRADQGFKFSSPIHVSPGKASAAGAEGGSKLSPEPAVGAATPQAPMWVPQMMKPKAMSPDIGGTSSSFKSYTKWNGSQKSDALPVSPALGLPVATTLKKGSVMDILGKNSTIDAGKSQNNTPLSEMFKKPAGSWECDTCMIQNKADTNRCVACSALKPGSKNTNNATPVGQDKPPLSALFEKPEGSWECGTCRIQNDVSVSKCLACTAPKPGSKAPEKGTQGSSNIPLSQLFKKPTGTWDCDVCMIQNPPSSAKCAACETPKPGGSKTGPATAGSSVPLSELFKKPEGSWDCDTCMIQNKSSASKCAACETPKPGVKAAPLKSDNSLAAMFKKPEGSWECDTCMVQNSATALRCIACDASKPGLQSAGIVAKPSSTDNQIVFNPGGGFSLKMSASDTTTTTTGSAGFKFSNSSASVISSTPLSSSGFSFGNKNSQKDTNGSFVNNNSVGSTAKTMPLGGGFQFKPPDSSSSSGDNSSSSLGGFKFGASGSNATVVSTSSNVSIPSGGFQFKAPAVTSSTTFSSVSSVTTGFTLSTSNVSQPTSGFQFGASSSNSTSSTSTVGFSFSNANGSSQNAGAPPTQGSLGLTSKTDALNTKTAAPSGVSFGSIASVAASSVTEAKKSDSSAPSESTVSFGAPVSATKSQASSSPFVFGAPVSSAPQSNVVGLGMGQSLASQSTSLVNGVFGAHDTKNALQSGNTGFGASTGGFTFGSKQNANPKRTIDGKDHEGPSAKIAPTFGSAAKDPVVNGGFNFNANAGSFAFGSNQPTQPAAGGFQFSATPSAPAATATPFAFSAKPDQATQPAKPGDVSFNTAPNFNFSAGQTDGNALFQFGSKAAPEQPSSNLFTFGAASSNPAPSQPSVPVFGGASAAAAAPGAVGSFNIGTASDTSTRKMKKAVRRIKPR